MTVGNTQELGATPTTSPHGRIRDVAYAAAASSPPAQPPVIAEALLHVHSGDPGAVTGEIAVTTTLPVIDKWSSGWTRVLRLMSRRRRQVRSVEFSNRWGSFQGEGGLVAEMLEFPLESGGGVMVRVSDDLSSLVTRGRGDRFEQAERTFEAALGTIRVVAHTVLGQLGGMARTPDEVRVEFGLELTAKAGAVLAAAGSTAQLRVGLTWRPDLERGRSGRGDVRPH